MGDERDLRSAPVPPLRADDHVRGRGRRAARGRLRRLHVPALRLVARSACAAAPVRRRLPPLRAARPPPARASPLAHAAEAAARQGAFWALHDALYADQGRLDDPHLWARVRARSASTSSASRPTAATRDVAERVARDVREALRAGADGDARRVVTAEDAPDRARYDGASSEYEKYDDMRPADRRAGQERRSTYEQ